jgi:proteasome lid subunit RPN8/RPN11
MIEIPEKTLTEMIAHAREQAPMEACGILGGKGGRVLRLYRARNADRSPVSYRLYPEEQYRIFMDLEARAWELLGIYHSHPSAPATPSFVDHRDARYPEASYIIISLQDPNDPQVRSFRMAQGNFAEEGILVT